MVLPCEEMTLSPFFLSSFSRFLFFCNRDEQKKRAEFQAQCDSGDVRGCHSLAEFLHLFIHDDEAALSLFRFGCDPSSSSKHRRYAPSCFSAASMLYERGRNAEAVDYFVKACLSGSVEGCANVGLIYRKGLAGVAPDRAKADEFSERACSAGDGKSCFQIAVSKGKNQEGLEFFEKACLLQYPWGCSNAYIMLTKGDGVPVDLERANRLKDLGQNIASSLGLKY